MMIKTGGGAITSSKNGTPTVFTDSEVDRTVKEHNLFPKLTEHKAT